MSKFDRYIRKLLPSIPVLSRSKLAMASLAAVDRMGGLAFREFDDLPPNRFRIRVGVGNRIVFNQMHYVEYSYQTWLHFLSEFTTLSSNVVDIGCGCGRAAYALKRLDTFKGHYIGIDVDTEMIDWCRNNFPTDKFEFIHVNMASRVYNPGGSAEKAKLPISDDSQDFVFSQSLFTHLLEDDVTYYVREAHRMLRRGTAMFMGVFCIDDMRAAGLLGNRWTFPNRLGEAYVESLKYPEAAVGYTRERLEGIAKAAGFSSFEVRPGHPQSLLVCRK
jgi:SAM-dependent methyltransferase